MIGRGVSVVLIILILYSPYMVLTRSEYQRVNLSMQIQTELAVPSDIEYNSSVSILSDSDFVEQNWPGNGTESSPYLISNLRFPSTELFPITIGNTRLHFVVNNCVFDPVGFGETMCDESAITLINVTNGAIENCNISSKSRGISTWNVNNTKFRYNRISDCGVSFYMNYLFNCEFSNNTIHSNFFALDGNELRNCSFTGNLVVEGEYGIYLNSACINNTVLQNRIGWFTEANAKDDGSSNLWRENSWNDWDGVGSYLISGSAGNIDNSPSLFNEDVLGPVFEYYRYNGITADLIKPLESFTFSVNVSDFSGVESVSLFIRKGQWVDDVLQSVWIEYIMGHQPQDEVPNRYTYTFPCNRSFSATYLYLATDTLGYSRQTDVDSFSFGCCMGYPPNPSPLQNAILTSILIGAGILILAVVFRRNKS